MLSIHNNINAANGEDKASKGQTLIAENKRVPVLIDKDDQLVNATENKRAHNMCKSLKKLNELMCIKSLRERI